MRTDMSNLSVAFWNGLATLMAVRAMSLAATETRKSFPGNCVNHDFGAETAKKSPGFRMRARSVP